MDYEKLPPRMRDGARRYVEDHIRPGNFLQAVLRNDLIGAFSNADVENKLAMESFARWANNLPSVMVGSRDNVEAWIAQQVRCGRCDRVHTDSVPCSSDTSDGAL